MENKYSIQTIQYGELGSATHIVVQFNKYFLGGNTANVNVIFCDETDNVYNMKELEMPTEVYENWGEDDTVILAWITSELDITLV